MINDIRASMGRILRMRVIVRGCHGNCLATLPQFITSVSQFGFLRNLSSYFRPWKHDVYSNKEIFANMHFNF